MTNEDFAAAIDAARYHADHTDSRPHKAIAFAQIATAQATERVAQALERNNQLLEQALLREAANDR